MDNRNSSAVKRARTDGTRVLALANVVFFCRVGLLLPLLLLPFAVQGEHVGVIEFPIGAVSFFVSSSALVLCRALWEEGGKFCVPC